MASSVLQGEITFFSKSKGDKITFVPDKRVVIEIGSNPNCDIRIEDADSLHMLIQLDTETGKVKASNLSKLSPISINGEVIVDKKLLKSGDVISLLNHQMRWDTKENLRRRTAALTKSARKEIKHRVIRTKKRLTIHNFQSVTQKTSSPEKFTEDDNKDLSMQKDIEKKEENEEKLSEIQSNENSSFKCNSLNLSGTLITSFTPQKLNSPRKTPLRNTPMSESPAKKTPVKNILNETSPQVSLSKSMHLVDLTLTPAPRQPRTPRQTPTISITPASAAKRTPLSVKKTPAPTPRNDTLLKSAIKNSSIKKRFNEFPPLATSSEVKGKVLFAPSPILDESNASSSVVSVSFCSASEQSVIEVESDGMITAAATVKEENLSTIIDNKLENENSQSGSSEMTSDEETKDLLNKISIAIEDKSNNSVVDDTFEEIHKQTTPGRSITCQSIFNVNTPAPGEITAPFNKIADLDDTKSLADNDEKMEKLNTSTEVAEDCFNLIQTAREFLTSNETEQVLSSRYSNVTPNDSIVTVTSSSHYDTTTPKLSILEVKKNASLVVSPVTRLSIGDNSTVVVENYNLNTDMKKSLRSTRKRIGNAMASLHDISQNLVSADETFEANESLNMSNVKNTDQSLIDNTTNDILSLDDQTPEEPISAVESIDAQVEIDRDENEENIPPSKNFIAFAEHQNNAFNRENEDENEFFEISNSDIGENDEKCEDDSSCSSEDDSDDDKVNDEFATDYIDNEREDGNTSSENNRLGAALKFRLSEQDLQEDGINMLDVSNVSQEEDIEIPATQDINADMAEINASQEIDHSEISATQEIEHPEVPATQEVEHAEISATQEMEHAEISAPQEIEHTEIPATQEMDDIEIPATEDIGDISTTSQNKEEEDTADISTQQMNEIIEGNGSINILDGAQTEEIESMIEEHLEESIVTEKSVSVQSKGEELFAPSQESRESDVVEVLSSQSTESDEASVIFSSQEMTTVKEEPCIPSKSEENLVTSSEDQIQNDDKVTDSGSPAKTPNHNLYGRFAPIESDNIPETSNLSHKMILDPIVDDSVTMKIMVHVEDSLQEPFEIEVQQSPPTDLKHQEDMINTSNDEEENVENQEKEDDNIEDKKCEFLEKKEKEEELQESNNAVADVKKEDSLIIETQGDAIDNDKPAVNIEEELTEKGDGEYSEREPVVEEPCVKKFAYITTDDEEEKDKSLENISTSENKITTDEIPENCNDEQKLSKEDIIEKEDIIVKEEDKNVGDEKEDKASENEIQIIEKNINEKEESEQQNIQLKESILEEVINISVKEDVEFSGKVTDIIEEHTIESNKQNEKQELDSPQKEKIEHQITTAPESSARRRVARINYADLAAGSPAKTPLRRGRSASVDEPSAQPTPTPRKGKSAKKIIMEPIKEISSQSSEPESKEKKNEIVEQLEEKQPMVQEQSNKKAPLRRGRSASVDIQQKTLLSKETPSKRTEEVKTGGRRLRVASVVETEEKMLVKEKAKKTSRQITPVEPPADEKDNKQNEVIEKTKEEKKRGGRQAQKSTKEEKLEENKSIAKKPSRGRAKKEEIVISNEEEATPNATENPKKNSRRKATVTAEKEKEKEELEEKPKEEEKTNVKKTRGRRGKNDEVIAEKVQEPAKKARSGRKVSANDNEKVKVPESPEKEETARKVRGRKGKAVEETVPLTISVEEPPAKAKRGRKKKEEKLDVEKEENLDVEKEEEKAPTKSSRSRRGGKTEEKDEQATELPKTATKKRGKEKIQKMAVEESAPKRRRGAASKTKVDNETEVISIPSSSNDKEVEKTGTPKKRVKKQVTIMTPATLEAAVVAKGKNKEANVEPAPSEKTSRKRQAQPSVIEEEPVVKRATRGKKK